MGKLAEENKLLGLEIIRFFASLAVLFYHYQHFINNITVTSRVVDVNQPFFHVLAPFYIYVYYGVHLFWCLSGYNFFWKYSYTISNNLISAQKFVIFRFSRLYPLHFVTLILETILQVIYFSQKDEYFIFQANTIPNFILQLFMASNWWIKDLSFNVPIWSVSIEIIIYVIFFLIMRYAGGSLIKCIVCISGAFFAYYLLGSDNVFLCLLFFFISGFVEIIQKQFKQFRRLISIISFLVIVVGFVISYRFQKDWICILLIIPAIIYLFSEYLKSVPKFMRGLVLMLGNITYSTYLIHFPIQLLIVLFYTFTKQKIPYYNPFFLLFFVIITLATARWIFIKFEVPMQKRIRFFFS